MIPFPGFASAGERAEYLLAEHRLGEVTGDDLTHHERVALLEELRHELKRVRRRAVAARLWAVGGSVAALVLAYTLLGVGPTAHYRWFSDVNLVTPLVEGPLWILLIGSTIAGLVAAEFGLRRGFKIAKAWTREAVQIERAIGRVERAHHSASVDPSPTAGEPVAR